MKKREILLYSLIGFTIIYIIGFSLVTLDIELLGPVFFSPIGVVILFITFLIHFWIIILE